MSSASRSILGGGVRRIGITAALAAVVILLFGLAQPAHADNETQIAKGLLSSKLYVTTDARATVSQSAQAQIRSALDNAHNTDIRVVIAKPGPTKPQLGRMLQSVQKRVGKGDTYLAVTTDGQVAAISKKFSSNEINQLVTRASGGGDITSGIVQFADLADQKAADKSKSSTTTSLVILGVLVLIAVGVVGLIFSARRRRREREAQQMADLKQSVQEDITLLGEDIDELDLNLTDPQLDPAAREEYTHAMDSYDAAKAAVDAARRPSDMQNVTKALEDGRYYMTAVRARLAGDPIPERRPPCFFNPQHGPSVQDVTWAPPGGAPRSVPACADDAARVLRGEDPDARLVSVGGHRRPYWDAGPAYAPYAGGYYSGFGGGDLLGGILIGTALGSMFGGGWGWGGGYGGGFDGGGGGGGDMGGFGGDGGDIGGGWDFGGGDFGGGDFGGGDF
ncbi:MAG TPA: hypothetical protein VH912_03035 [Streptosporangiaceae bacterium]|jgi:hypothetical protein